MRKYKMSSESLFMTRKGFRDCIGCKKCMDGCPMLHRFCENPKELLKSLSQRKEFEKELPYSCMLCGYCEEVCPTGVSFDDIFFSYRENLEKIHGGKLPKELGLGGVDLHQKLSFSGVFSKKLKLEKNSVFFPGCALMGAKSEAILKVNSYLDEKLGGCEIMTYCCGKPTKYMGKNYKFDRNIEKIQMELDKKKKDRVVVGCLNCYKTLEDKLKGVEVVSLWPLLDSCGAVEDLGLDYSEAGINPTIHDPCPTRKDEDIHSSVRNMLKQMKVECREMDYSGKKTLCCGAGAMVSISQKEVAERHMERRCREAKSDCIVTYCQECTESFAKQDKDSIHMIDLLFGDHINLKSKESSLAGKWLKRWILSNLKR